jgi:hypothetical protein
MLLLWCKLISSPSAIVVERLFFPFTRERKSKGYDDGAHKFHR